MKLVFLASMVTGGAKLLPSVAAWQPLDVRTEAILTAAFLLGIASLLRRNVVTRPSPQPAQIARPPLRDAA